MVMKELQKLEITVNRCPQDRSSAVSRRCESTEEGVEQPVEVLVAADEAPQGRRYTDISNAEYELDR